MKITKSIVSHVATKVMDTIRIKFGMDEGMPSPETKQLCRDVSYRTQLKIYNQIENEIDNRVWMATHEIIATQMIRDKKQFPTRIMYYG